MEDGKTRRYILPSANIEWWLTPHVEKKMHSQKSVRKGYDESPYELQLPTHTCVQNLK